MCAGTVHTSVVSTNMHVYYTVLCSTPRVTQYFRVIQKKNRAQTTTCPSNMQSIIMHSNIRTRWLLKLSIGYCPRAHYIITRSPVVFEKRARSLPVYTYDDVQTSTIPYNYRS